ncbi:PREDICTED: F-box/kelch-repeat protein At3g06240-like [Camelina sativa]|uniref:F-box/kelch-repeat protein At3g06240-like n=1 Tax=Camelina sativa TaxID=90675 RepID=A0ABM0U737_CAMSA|nr:PREDICTED: F-box/kelch-repeat protein At3g06240-like [Camelina sativa]
MKAIQLLWEAIMEATKRGRWREDDDDGGEVETSDKAYLESLVLPPEIITEILLRLPAKSVGRFRCVSKLFCSLSSNPRFAKSHLDLILRNEAVRSLHRRLIVSSHNLYSLDFDSIGCCEGIRDLAATELNYPLKDDASLFSEMIRSYVRDHQSDGVDEDDRRVMLTLNVKPYRRNWVEIVGSSNGLVCISPGEGVVFLYNPTTGDSKRLPETIPHGIDNFQSNGFGFDDLTDDYKVVKLVASSDDVFDASVYSLKADSWRRICSLNYEHNDGFYTSGVHFNGAIHWVFTQTSHNNQRVVVAFDLRTEEFREMPLPDEAEDCQHRFRNFVVGCLNGCLCVVNSCYEEHDDIWVMYEYGEAKSWSRIRISWLYRSMKPQCSTNNDEEVLLELDGGMVLYNFETAASSVLRIRGVKLSDGFEANTYLESLISPNSYYMG